jgi:hypothetical protein
MSSTRRDFLATAAAVGGSLITDSTPAAAQAPAAVPARAEI